MRCKKKKSRLSAGGEGIVMHVVSLCRSDGLQSIVSDR